MTVYIDIVLCINFLFDFILLTSVSLILNRRTSINKILLSSLVGTLMVIVKLLDNSYLLYIFKFINTILMLVICFGYKNIKYTISNLIYLYISAITLGGSLYLITLKFSYNTDKLVIYRNSYSISIIILLIISPIIMYLYINNIKKLKNIYNNQYKVIIYLKDEFSICTNAFLDTGNGLYDPYKHRPIMLVSSKLIPDYDDYIIVPCNTINGYELLKCIRVDKIYIEGVGYRYNLLIGIYLHNINIDGVDAIMHRDLL